LLRAIVAARLRCNRHGLGKDHRGRRQSVADEICLVVGAAIAPDASCSGTCADTCRGSASGANRR